MQGRPSCLSDMYLLAEAGASAVRICVPSFWSQRPITTEFSSFFFLPPTSTLSPQERITHAAPALYIPSGIRSYLKNETFGFVNIISNPLHKLIALLMLSALNGTMCKTSILEKLQSLPKLKINILEIINNITLIRCSFMQGL